MGLNSEICVQSFYFTHSLCELAHRVSLDFLVLFLFLNMESTYLFHGFVLRWKLENDVKYLSQCLLHIVNAEQ